MVAPGFDRTLVDGLCQDVVLGLVECAVADEIGVDLSGRRGAAESEVFHVEIIDPDAERPANGLQLDAAVHERDLPREGDRTTHSSGHERADGGAVS